MRSGAYAGHAGAGAVLRRRGFAVAGARLQFGFGPRPGPVGRLRACLEPTFVECVRFARKRKEFEFTRIRAVSLVICAYPLNAGPSPLAARRAGGYLQK